MSDLKHDLCDLVWINRNIDLLKKYGFTVGIDSMGIVVSLPAEPKDNFEHIFWHSFKDSNEFLGWAQNILNLIHERNSKRKLEALLEMSKKQIED